MWEYSDILKDHFMNPRNVGVIEDPTVDIEVGSIVCGDALRLQLKIDKETQTIIDAKFQTFGCGSAIASASALTEMIKGKTIEEVREFKNKDIVDYLGGMPPEKMHCSVMGEEAIEKAIAVYKGEKYEKDDGNDGVIVCKCFGVTDNKIRKVIRENNLKTIEEVTNYTKAGGGCGSCLPKIEDILKEEIEKLKD